MKKIIIALIAIIIIAGITIICTTGLNFDLQSQDSKKIELYLKKEFETADIEKITNEVMGNQEVIIQKVEVYEDTASVIAKEITDEQKQNLITKVNEKYGTELKAEDIEIKTVTNLRGRDIVKPYIIPFATVLAVTLAYMAIRYRKLKSIKIILKTGIVAILAQALLLSIIAITRIPVGRLTMPAVIAVYILTICILTNKFEKQLKKHNAEIEKIK